MERDNGACVVWELRFSLLPAALLMVWAVAAPAARAQGVSGAARPAPAGPERDQAAQAEPSGPPMADQAASADPTDAATARARELFRQGREALGQGNYWGACQKFEASHQLVVTGGTLVNWALCEEKLGRLTGAIAHFQAFLARAEPGDDRRPIAESHLATLLRIVPRLVLSVSSQVPPGARVFLDNQIVSPERYGSELRVDPGHHRVVLALDRETLEVQDIDTPEQSLQRYELGARARASSPPIAALALPALPGSTPTPRPLSTALLTAGPPDAPDPPERQDRTLAWTFAGLSAASLITSLTTGLLAHDRVNAVRHECPQKVCTPEGLSAATQARNLALASDLTLLAAAVGAGFAIHFWSSGASRPNSVSMAFEVSPHQNSILCSYRH